jgi:large subunit ribosomal protein L9
MQVILCEDVPNVGKIGELVNVKEGFGRNYLLPRKLAVAATPRNMRRLKHDQRVIEQQDGKRRKDAETIKAAIEALTVTIAKQTGEEDKLFGSVTNREIADALKDQGHEIDRKQINLEQPIKALGVYTIDIKLARDINAALKLWVVAK